MPESATIELIFPSSYDQSSYGVPRHIDRSSAHAEEAINAKNQRHSGNGYCRNNDHGGHEGNEGRPLHAASAFGSKQGHAENDELLSQGQLRVGRLSHEERSESHVQARTVSVEGVSGRDHQADESLGASELFKLDHETWQRGFRGTGGQHQKNLFAKKPQKAQDAEAGHAGNNSEDDDDEKDGGDVERSHQFDERSEGSNAVFADGESHCAKRSEGGEAHQDGDNAENDASQRFQDIEECFRALAGDGQGKAEQQRNEQDLQDVALGKGVDNGVRNDVGEELGDALSFRLARIFRYGLGVQRERIDIETISRTYHIANDEADDQRKRGDGFEVQQRLAADTADLLHVLHTGDSRDQGAKDH